MGIHGLLPFLKPFVKKISIEDFKGKTLGVDAMCWMHKGAFACSQELVQGIDTDRFIFFFLKMCEVLRSSDIKPVIVFDGASLPAKAAENAQRNERRERNRSEALELFKQRDAGVAIDERQLSSKCEGAIKITNEMIARLMTALTELNIRFCVAPFEADAQLAYLCRIGWVDAVITEDSDLLAYGCPHTIFKMDKHGNGEHIALPCLQLDAVRPPPAAPADAAAAPARAEAAQAPADAAAAEDAGEITIEDLEAALDADMVEVPSPTAGGRGRGRGRGAGRGKARGRGGASAANAAAAAGEDRVDDGEGVVENLKHWTAEKFTEFCIICGSDYNSLPGLDVNIKGFGQKTAFGYLRRFQSSEKMLTWMRGDTRWNEKFPCALDEYLQRFFKILSVFFHHVVFDPRLGAVSIARSFPGIDRTIPGIDLTSLCGIGPAKDIIKGVWMGRLNARTLEPRTNEALTPAERRTLDGIMSRKRQEQKQYHHQARFEQTLRDDAVHIAAQRAAKQAAEASQAAAGASQPAGADAGHDKALEALLTEEAPDEPKEMCLRNGDSKAIFAVLEAEERARQGEEGGEMVDVDGPSSNSIATPSVASQNPYFSGRARCAAPSMSSAATPSNPFARKRVALSQSQAASQGQDSSSQRPAKFFRSLDSRGSMQAASQMSRPIATGSRSNVHTVVDLCSPRPVQPESHQRHIAGSLLGPQGGRSAVDAAKIVLAQRGIMEYEALPPNKDKGKLTGFFKQQKQAPKVQAKPAPQSALAEWKSRPWEEPEAEEDTSAYYANPLSMPVNRFKSLPGKERFNTTASGLGY